VPGSDKSAPVAWLGAFLRKRAQGQREWRSAVQAQRLDGINKLAQFSDAELIATAPGLADESHQMEMARRLKAAIGELTAETIAARMSAGRASGRIQWLNVFIVVLTATLVALTVVLAVRS
jgi:hypothetical protein